MAPFPSLTIAMVVLTTAVITVQAATSITLPLPEIGTYGVDIFDREIIDHSRLDPYIAGNGSRRLMTSVFIPTTTTTSQCEARNLSITRQYMPADVAQVYGVAFGSLLGTSAETVSELLASFLVQTCPAQNHTSPYSHSQGLLTASLDTILISPGLGSSRLFHTAQAQALAAQGFLVVIIDHPGDSAAVKYPDGTIAYAVNITTEAETDRDLAVRVADIKFIAESIPTLVSGNNDTAAVPEMYSPSTSKIGLLGHSLGGAAAVAALPTSDQFAGAIDLDGELRGPVLHQNLTKPVMLIANPSNAAEGGFNGTNFDVMWPNLRGWKRQLTLQDSAHYTFTDAPLLFEVAGLDEVLPASALDSFVGAISGQRAMNVIAEYVGTFMDMVLRCESSGLLQRESANWPEVVIVR